MLAFNAEKGQHLVFYDDGEDEWVDLSLQHVTWHEHVRGVTVAHGLPAGEISAASLVVSCIPCMDRYIDSCTISGAMQAAAIDVCPVLTLLHANVGLLMVLSSL